MLQVSWSFFFLASLICMRVRKVSQKQESWQLSKLQSHPLCSQRAECLQCLFKKKLSVFFCSLCYRWRYYWQHCFARYLHSPTKDRSWDSTVVRDARKLSLNRVRCCLLVKGALGHLIYSAQYAVVQNPSLSYRSFFFFPSSLQRGEAAASPISQWAMKWPGNQKALILRTE